MTVSLQKWPALPDIRLTDSLPIILSKRPDSACAAKDFADKGCCSTKKLDHPGLKLHLVGVDRLATMLLPESMQFSRASTNDLAALRQ